MTERKSPTVLPKKDFVTMLQESFNAEFADRSVTISRDRADKVLTGFMAKLQEKALQGPFSVRGVGRYYTVTGKTGNQYLRFKKRLK